MMDKPTIHVVDDDPAFRKSVARLLRLSGYETAHYESGSELLEQLKECGPGCILLDLDMPGLSGLQLQTNVAGLEAPLPIVFLTGRGNIQASVKAMKAGAEDFLCKPISKQELLAAIERAVERDAKARAARAELTDRRARVDTLTPREKQVFGLVVTGKLNKQIAYEISTTERTVKAHRQKVMHKLQARSVIDLVSFAERLTVHG